MVFLVFLFVIYLQFFEVMWCLVFPQANYCLFFPFSLFICVISLVFQGAFFFLQMFNL